MAGADDRVAGVTPDWPEAVIGGDRDEACKELEIRTASKKRMIRLSAHFFTTSPG